MATDVKLFIFFSLLFVYVLCFHFEVPSYRSNIIIIPSEKNTQKQTPFFWTVVLEVHSYAFTLNVQL